METKGARRNEVGVQVLTGVERDSNSDRSPSSYEPHKCDWRGSVFVGEFGEVRNPRVIQHLRPVLFGVTGETGREVCRSEGPCDRCPSGGPVTSPIRRKG